MLERRGRTSTLLAAGLHESERYLKEEKQAC